jgi:hypothetical protein
MLNDRTAADLNTPRDALLLGLDSGPDKKEKPSVAGRIIGGFFLAIAMSAVIGTVGMLTAWWLIWMFKALFG